MDATLLIFCYVGSWLWPWVVYTLEVNWIYVTVLVALIMLMADLWDCVVIYGSLRFVLVVTRIDVVSWCCSMTTLRCVQRLHCVLLPCYTWLGSCSSGGCLLMKIIYFLVIILLTLDIWFGSGFLSLLCFFDFNTWFMCGIFCWLGMWI
jgi:hypothetical protein